MGSERSSTTRQRIAGKICCNCGTLLPADKWTGGERHCDKCAKPKRVYMSFFERPDKWVYLFLEADLQTPIGRIRTVSDVNKLRDLINKTPTKQPTEFIQALEYGITNGRCGVHLEVTPEQYKKLKGR